MALTVIDLDDLLKNISLSVHHYRRMFFHDIHSVERSIRHFEAALTELRFMREHLIREQTFPPNGSYAITEIQIKKNSYNDLYCNYKGAEEILGYKRGAIRLLIESGDISYKQRGTGKKCHFIKSELYKYRDGIKLINNS